MPYDHANQVLAIATAVLLVFGTAVSRAEERTVRQNEVLEISFRSSDHYDNPYLDVVLDVVVSNSSGRAQVVPAFWAGDNVWKVRFGSPSIGDYEYVSRCSNANDIGLHEQRGRIVGLTDEDLVRGKGNCAQAEPCLTWLA